MQLQIIMSLVRVSQSALLVTHHKKNNNHKTVTKHSGWFNCDLKPEQKIIILDHNGSDHRQQKLGANLLKQIIVETTNMLYNSFRLYTFSMLIEQGNLRTVMCSWNCINIKGDICVPTKAGFSPANRLLNLTPSFSNPPCPLNANSILLFCYVILLSLFWFHDCGLFWVSWYLCFKDLQEILLQNVQKAESRLSLIWRQEDKLLSEICRTYNNLEINHYTYKRTFL